MIIDFIEIDKLYIYKEMNVLEECVSVLRLNIAPRSPSHPLSFSLNLSLSLLALLEFQLDLLLS